MNRMEINPETVPLAVGGYSQAVEVHAPSRLLAVAGMSYQHLVKVTTFLTHADQAEQNSEIRRKHLGTLRPALTAVVVETLESKWLLEVEAVAAA